MRLPGPFRSRFDNVFLTRQTASIRFQPAQTLLFKHRGLISPRVGSRVTPRLLLIKRHSAWKQSRARRASRPEKRSVYIRSNGIPHDRSCNLKKISKFLNFIYHFSFPTLFPFTRRNTEEATKKKKRKGASGRSTFERPISEVERPVARALRRKCTLKERRKGTNKFSWPFLGRYFQATTPGILRPGRIYVRAERASRRHYLHPMITINSHSEKPPSGVCTVSVLLSVRAMRAATWPQSPCSLWVLTQLFNKYMGACVTLRFVSWSSMGFAGLPGRAQWNFCELHIHSEPTGIAALDSLVRLEAWNNVIHYRIFIIFKTFLSIPFCRPRITGKFSVGLKRIDVNPEVVFTTRLRGGPYVIQMPVEDQGKLGRRI